VDVCLEQITQSFYHYTFFALSAILVVIGTLFMYKKYDQGENSGLYLGAFWLFTGFLLIMVYFKIIN